jgi:2Fe-2S ferredoxin
VREGFGSLAAVDGGRGRSARSGVGPDAVSRLSCQAKSGDAKLVVEIPKYTINYAKENK